MSLVTKAPHCRQVALKGPLIENLLKPIELGELSSARLCLRSLSVIAESAKGSIAALMSATLQRRVFARAHRMASSFMWTMYHEPFVGRHEPSYRETNRHRREGSQWPIQSLRS